MIASLLLLIYGNIRFATIYVSVICKKLFVLVEKYLNTYFLFSVYFQGYDHSYFFIATFIEEHINHHAKFLCQWLTAYKPPSFANKLWPRNIDQGELLVTLTSLS